MFAHFTKAERHTVHLQVLPSATPQRGMFRDISHSQALLGALVKCFLKTVVHKIN
jgi:hypothetical protein